MGAPARVVPCERVARQLYAARWQCGDTLAACAKAVGAARLDVARCELGLPAPAGVLAALCARYAVTPGWVAEGAAAPPRRLA